MPEGGQPGSLRDAAPTARPDAGLLAQTSSDVVEMVLEMYEHEDKLRELNERGRVIKAQVVQHVREWQEKTSQPDSNSEVSPRLQFRRAMIRLICQVDILKREKQAAEARFGHLCQMVSEHLQQAEPLSE